MTESRDTAAKRRAAYMAQGLTSRGKPRKPRAKPQPHQTILYSPPHKRKPKPKRAKVETPEQRRERGRMLHASPLALSIEERVRKRVAES